MDTMDTMSLSQVGVNSADIGLFTIPPTHIDRAWKDGASKLYFGLLRYSPECTEDQLKYRLARGDYVLLALAGGDRVPVGWAAVSFVQYPMFRSMHIYSTYAPGHMIPAVFELLKEYAQKCGASAIEGNADEAVSRILTRKLGFKEVSRLMRYFM